MGGAQFRPPLAGVVLAVVVLAVAVAGGLWIYGADAGGSRPVGLDAGDRYAALDAVSATEVTVIERGDETRRAVANVTRAPGTDRRRVETVEDADRRYDLTVANGSTLWLYDRDADHVKRVPLSGDPPAGLTRGERIEQLFAQLNVTAGDAPTSVSAGPTVSPLPVAPRAGGDSPAPKSADAGVTEIRYNGTATVDGRETHVLHLAAGSDGSGGGDGHGDGSVYRQTLWVDAEWFYPLRTHTEWTESGERVSVRTTYRNVTFDPDLPEGAFSFDPPASASVEAVETPRTETYGSVAALRADAAVAVPEPDVPPSFGLTYATRTTGEIRGVGLRYANETSRLTVAKYNRTVPTEGDRQVTVDGREAELSIGSPVSVSWNCDEYRYTVRAERVSAGRAVEFARSVGCR